MTVTITTDWDDPMKHIIRGKLRDAIERWLIPYKRPEKMNVFFLPGKNVLEWSEVFEPLGIPKRNLVGMEQDLRIAADIKTNHPDMDIQAGTDLEYLATTSKRFDIVSLDYLGQQTFATRESLRNLSARHVLMDQSILFTNFCGTRESDDMKFFLAARRANEQYAKTSDFTMFKSALITAIENADEIDLKDAREGMAHQTRESMLNGVISMRKPAGLLAHPYVNLINGRLRTIYDEQSSDPVLGKIMRKMTKMQWNEELEEFRKKMLTADGPSEELWLVAQESGLVAHLKEKYGANVVTAKTLAKMRILSDMDGYFTMRQEKYNYISNKGTSMITDIYSLRRPTNTFRKIDDLIRVDSNGCISVNPSRMTQGSFSSAFRKIGREMHEFMVSHTEAVESERVFLGSSYKPKERISQRNAVLLLQAGCKPEEIRECYAGPSLGELKAWKAMVTMKERMESGRQYPTGAADIANKFFENLK